MTTPVPYSRVLIVHGFGATPEDHWFGWLADTVSAGAERLALPQSVAPRASAWVPIVVDALAGAGPETAVVAHSLGCVTVAQALRRRVGSAGVLGRFIAVAPFAGPIPPIGDPELDAFIETGLADFVDIDLTQISPSVQRVDVIRSDNDPIVPPEASDAFARQTSASLHVVPGAGHFLASEGVDRLDIAIELLTER